MAVVHGLIAVPHSNLVHLLEEVIIDCSELLDGVSDFPFVQVWILLPQLRHHAAPFLQGLPVSLFHLSPALLQDSDVILRFSQELHGVGLGHEIPLCLFSGKPQISHPLPVGVFHSGGSSSPLVHRGKIGVNEPLGQLLVFDDVPDVPLHGLSGVEDSGRLVLPVVGGLQEGVRLGFRLLLSAPVPRLDALGQPLIFLSGLVNSLDSLHIEPFWVQVFQLDLTTEQTAYLYSIIIGQQILCGGFLVCSPGILHPFPAFLHLGLCLWNSLLLFCLGSGPLIGISLHISQIAQHIRDRHLKVVLRPPFEVLGAFPVVFVQVTLHQPKVVHYLCNVHQLVRRV